MTILDKFTAAFGVWEEARPYIHMIVDEQEMALVVRMQDQSMTADEVAHLIGMTYEQASAFLQRCYSRCMVDKTVENGITTYSAADFGARLDHFVKFENWDDIPPEARKAIDRRFLDEFTAKHRPNVELKMQGASPENALPNDTIMLLSEVALRLSALGAKLRQAH
jgi:hypothetical protein